MHTSRQPSGNGAIREAADVADAPASCARASDDGAPTFETRLWLPEYEWIAGLAKSPENNFPAFRFPDLVSACVSLICGEVEGAQRLFRHLSTTQLQRDPKLPRRDTEVWRDQFEQLQTLQRSPANRFPNPRFQIDHLATGCVALVQSEDSSGVGVYKQARLNLKERAQRTPAALE